MHYLEVLHGRLRDPAVEVQHIGLCVIVPHWGLIVQLDQVLHGSALPLGEQALVVLSKGTVHSVLITVKTGFFSLFPGKQ